MKPETKSPNIIRRFKKNTSGLAGKIKSIDYKAVIKHPRFLPVLVVGVVAVAVITFSILRASASRGQGYVGNKGEGSNSSAKNLKDNSKSDPSKAKANRNDSASRGSIDPKVIVPKFDKNAQLSFVDQELKSKQITQDQANKLKAKIGEVDKFMSSLDSKTLTQRSKLVSRERVALRKWAKDNGIPPMFVTRLVIF